MKLFRSVAILILGVAATSISGEEEKKEEPAKKPAKPKEVAGKADVLRHVKKHFATYLGTGESGEIRLWIEGQDAESTWPVLPDAQFKIDGWWGRLEQFEKGNRVWVWLAVNRKKEPISILMMADEISEQDIHDEPWTVKSIESETVTLEIPDQEKVSSRSLRASGHDLKTGDVGLVQTAGEKIVRWLSPEELEEKRTVQQEWLRERWRKEGLPGMIAFLHPIGGEMEVFLDHEGMRWGRCLTNGDAVSFETAGRTIKGQVKRVEPWRERTRVHLVTGSGMDQLDLQSGQRIHLQVPEPPVDVQASDFPTDIGRVEGKDARVEWFLATIYCPCGVAGDRCTGMFYTLSSCNVNACGAPKEHRRVIGGLIDKGLTDREIFDRLRAQKGRDIWMPHLLR